MKRITRGFMILVLVFSLGCTGMSRTQQSTLSGAGIGAVSGGILGGVVGGSPATGALIGAGVGGAAGYLLEQ
ncbi:MAG: YMGG-like glycine zipper-containing protein [Desulfatirhabdiaceae bacterium]